VIYLNRYISSNVSNGLFCLLLYVVEHVVLFSRSESHLCLNNAGFLGSVLHFEHTGYQRKLTSKTQTLRDVYISQLLPRFRTNIALNTKGYFFILYKIFPYMLQLSWNWTGYSASATAFRP